MFHMSPLGLFRSQLYRPSIMHQTPFSCWYALVLSMRGKCGTQNAERKCGTHPHIHARVMMYWCTDVMKRSNRTCVLVFPPRLPLTSLYLIPGTSTYYRLLPSLDIRHPTLVLSQTTSQNRPSESIGWSSWTGKRGWRRLTWQRHVAK